MIDQARYEAEFAVLKRKLPENAWQFVGLNGPRPFLAAAVRTRSGTPYVIQIELEKFPRDVPKVFVMQMLRDCRGRPMDEARHDTHTLRSEHGWTRLCHYGPDSWTENVSLYLIYVKCALWLNIYELHLRTGKPMEYYLKRQA